MHYSFDSNNQIFTHICKTYIQFFKVYLIVIILYSICGYSEIVIWWVYTLKTLTETKKKKFIALLVLIDSYLCQVNAQSQVYYIS